ncbi:tetratricopeptide repeat protein [Silvibacterium sp.]|uniref:tetratricopeptide repeat protein n=1 Tax=Silvibacterium sp. TaxID=1964179 RepID=UPI0039E3E235
MSRLATAALLALLAPACLRAQSQPQPQTAPAANREATQATAAFRAGYAAAAKGNLAAARTHFERAVHLAPQVEEGHSALGAILVQLHDYPAAIAELNQALALKPADSAALANLALAYANSGDAAHAAPLFAQLAAQPQPLAPDLLAAWGRIEAASGERAAAQRHLEQAVAADPQNAQFADDLGSLYAQQQNWQAAAQSFRRAIDIDPSFALAHLHLGVVLENTAQPSDPATLQQLNTAATLAPQSPAVQLELGKALAAAGRDDEAISHFQQAHQLDAAAPEPANQLAMALQRSGQVEAAIPLFTQVVEAQPDNAPALSNLALALIQTGKAKDAIAYIQRELTLMPNDVNGHQVLGVAYLQQSDIDDAMHEFRTALAAEPDNPQLHYNLGLALKLKDDLPGAVKELEEAARLDPASPDAPYTLGILSMQAGRFDDAVKNFTQSLAARPNNGDTWAILGSVYRQMGRNDDAAAALRKAIALLPNQPGPHITLAGVLQEQGHKDEAAAERKQAADLTRVAVNRQRAQFALNAANASLQKGQVADAVSRYQEAIASDPTFAEAHRQLALAYDREGRASDAAAERAAAQKLEGGSHP